ncbi:recombinase family protein [Natronobacillus azotifigens]|uniref:recombinase family protein n=1 Tax=Natronobacillus azotifigens TaxID=472978 RepID=UPI003AF129C3
MYYREYLEGISQSPIARSLKQEGILLEANKKKWRPKTIKKILQNKRTSVRKNFILQKI